MYGLPPFERKRLYQGRPVCGREGIAAICPGPRERIRAAQNEHILMFPRPANVPSPRERNATVSAPSELSNGLPLHHGSLPMHAPRARHTHGGRRYWLTFSHRRAPSTQSNHRQPHHLLTCGPRPRPSSPRDMSPSSPPWFQANLR